VLKFIFLVKMGIYHILTSINSGASNAGTQAAFAGQPSRAGIHRASIALLCPARAHRKTQALSFDEATAVGVAVALGHRNAGVLTPFLCHGRAEGNKSHQQCGKDNKLHCQHYSLGVSLV
jgi:hypothetical protein